MTQEDKELLLKDLCTRLPYLGNWVQYDGQDYVIDCYGHGRVSLLPSVFSSAVGAGPLVEEVKPYLRPMSSMTEEEREEFRILGGVMSYSPQHNTWAIAAFSPEAYDWLDKNMFDYRGLIPMGLALEAKEGMYKTK